MLLVASETGHVYTFATRKLQPMITSEAGKALIQTCLNSPDPPQAPHHHDQRMSATGFEETELTYAVNEDEHKVRQMMYSTPINSMHQGGSMASPSHHAAAAAAAAVALQTHHHQPQYHHPHPPPTPHLSTPTSTHPMNHHHHHLTQSSPGHTDHTGVGLHQHSHLEALPPGGVRCVGVGGRKRRRRRCGRRRLLHPAGQGPRQVVLPRRAALLHLHLWRGSRAGRNGACRGLPAAVAAAAVVDDLTVMTRVPYMYKWRRAPPPPPAPPPLSPPRDSATRICRRVSGAIEGVVVMVVATLVVVQGAAPHNSPHAGCNLYTGAAPIPTRRPSVRPGSRPRPHCPAGSQGLGAVWPGRR
ncbi:Serum response factor [Portunus trituberculatus]|uniref:Serum response factor n=1 Tax=Portunus trituberculatus TaxID=210409 RepID=A0A5B7H7D2_PORTR|nr:Serum response factor [Portunus trituberculatus]